MNANTPNKVEKLHKPSIFEFLGIEKLSETEIQRDLQDIESFRIATSCESDTDSVKSENVLSSSYPVKPRRVPKSPRNSVQDNISKLLSTTTISKSNVTQNDVEKTEYVTFDKKTIEDTYQLIEAIQRTSPDIWKNELQYESLQQQIAAYRHFTRQKQLKFSTQKQQQENYFKVFQGLLARAIKLNQIYNKRVLILHDIIKSFNNLSKLSSKLQMTQVSTGQSSSIVDLNGRNADCNQPCFPTPVVVHLRAPDRQHTQLVYEGQHVPTPYGEGIIRNIIVSAEKIEMSLPYGVLHTSFGQLLSWSVASAIELSRLMKLSKLSRAPTTTTITDPANSQVNTFRSTSPQSSTHRLGVLDSLSLESTNSRWLSMKPSLNIPVPIRSSIDSILRFNISSCQRLHQPASKSGGYCSSEDAVKAPNLQNTMDDDILSSPQVYGVSGDEINGIIHPSQAISSNGCENNGTCSNVTEISTSAISVSMVSKKRSRGKSSAPIGDSEPAVTQSPEAWSSSELSNTKRTNVDTHHRDGERSSHTELATPLQKNSSCEASTKSMAAEAVDPANGLYSLVQMTARHIPIQDVLLALLQPDQIRLMLGSHVSLPAPRFMATTNSNSIANLALFNEFLLSDPLQLNESGFAGNLAGCSSSRLPTGAIMPTSSPSTPAASCVFTCTAIDPQTQALKTHYHTALRERLRQLRSKLADYKRVQSECWSQMISAQRQCAHAVQLKAMASILRPTAGSTEAVANPTVSKPLFESENATTSKVPMDVSLETNHDHPNPPQKYPDPPKRRPDTFPQHYQDPMKRRRVQLDPYVENATINLETAPSSSEMSSFSSSRQSSRRGSASASVNTSVSGRTSASKQSQSESQNLAPESDAVAMNGHQFQRNGDSRSSGNSSKSHDHGSNGNKEDKTILNSKVKRKRGY